MKKFLKKHKKVLAIVGGIAIIGLGVYESYEKEKKKNQEDIDETKSQMIALMNAGLMYADEHPDEIVKQHLSAEENEEQFKRFDPDKRVESL